MLGPPPSAAGPSQQGVSSSTPASSGYSEAEDISRNQSIPFASSSPSHAAPTTARQSVNYGVNPTQNMPYYSGSHPQSTYYPTQPHGQTASQNPPFAYYHYPLSPWGGSWPPSAYSYGAAGTYQHSHPDASQIQPSSVTSQPLLEHEAPSVTPSPLPPFPKDWDAVIASFLSSAGLTQALRGFKCDMIVMNPEWEQKKIPAALGELMKNLLHLSEGDEARQQTDHVEPEQRPLEERKLNYVHLANNVEPRSQTSVTKSISQFLAQNRARNDASNRTEFLQSLAEKRRRIEENGISDPCSPIPSCARTDAKTQDRDVQMKYDIAKNEDGPLRRTLQSNTTGLGVTPESANKKPVVLPQSTTAPVTDQQGPPVDERLQNVESHLAIRYVPSPPRSMMDRLRYLEEHIIRLEKDYPPWAALHFNQPNRGWPPPPRPHPIIVPSHLTSSTAHETYAMSSAKSEHNPHAPAPSISPSATTPHSFENTPSSSVKGRGKSGRSTKSSLHRAVMEKLEVQKAMHDLAGDG